MRDTRFIARHRGGPLSREHHRQLAAWAADCAERLLGIFETHNDKDERPSRAVEAARAWSLGEVPAGTCMKAAVAAHAAAREATHPAAVAVARAAGHAAATAHAADHCLGVVFYGLKAVYPAALESERAWQLEKVPAELRGLIVSALEKR